MKGYCPVDITGPSKASVYINGASEAVSTLQTIGAGGMLVMECRATSKPDPEFIWYKHGSTTPVGTGALFVIDDATVTQSGQYSCLAQSCRSNDKTVYSDFVEVVVTPIVTSPAPVTSTPAGGTDNLTFDFPTKSCQIFGDPHFNSFDGLGYDFNGQCDYVLAMDCEMGTWFIYGRLRPCGGGTCLESVTVYYNNQIIELQRGWLINHLSEKISPKNFRDKIIAVGDTFRVRFDGRFLHVEFMLAHYTNQYGQDEAKTVKIVWDGYMSVEIHSPHTGATCGICGNNDGLKVPAFYMRWGGTTENAEEFGDSWKIDRYNECAVTPDKSSNEEICGANYITVKSSCEAIFAYSKFQQCHLAHDNTDYIAACIYDECAGSTLSSDYSAQCVVASAYAARCEHPHYLPEDPQSIVTLDVSGWEEAVGCPNAEQLFDTIIDSGCPQVAAEDDEVTRALISEG